MLWYSNTLSEIIYVPESSTLKHVIKRHLHSVSKRTRYRAWQDKEFSFLNQEAEVHRAIFLTVRVTVAKCS